MFKKLLSIALCAVMVLGMGTTAFANTPLEQCVAYSPEDYTHYTYNLSLSRSLQNTTNEQKINDTIAYVESLNLDDMGYTHIKEACIAELERYREDDVEIEKYTVLVPQAHEMDFYGTYLGKNFYYQYTSVSDLRRNTKGDAKITANTTSWDHWITGAINLGMCFVNAKWTVPYTLISTITGVTATSEVHNGSYNEYVEQFTNTVTRTIYKEKTANNYTPGYQDQTSSLRVNMYFCPVGTAFSSDYIPIGKVFEGDVVSNKLSKDSILQIANTYANSGTEMIYRVSYIRLQEIWG